MLSAFCRIQQPHSEPYPERTPTPAGGVRSRNTSLSRFRVAGGRRCWGRMDHRTAIQAGVNECTGMQNHGAGGKDVRGVWITEPQSKPA